MVYYEIFITSKISDPADQETNLTRKSFEQVTLPIYITRTKRKRDVTEEDEYASERLLSSNSFSRFSLGR